MNESPDRDAKILEIGEGTPEVRRMLIARQPGLGRSAVLFGGNPITRVIKPGIVIIAS